MGIRSLISYEGESAKELLNDFHDAVDTYLEHCKEEGKKPELAFKGSFNIRLSPALHKKLFLLCNRTPDVYQSVYRRHLRGLSCLETRDLNECLAFLNRTPAYQSETLRRSVKQRNQLFNAVLRVSGSAEIDSYHECLTSPPQLLRGTNFETKP